MTTQLQNHPNSAAEMSPKTLRMVACVAFLIAAVPHSFLQFPHLLLAAGQNRAWIGLSIWAPLMLAAAALMTDTSLQGHFERARISSTLRTAAAVLLPLGVITILVQLHFQLPFLGRPVHWQSSVLFAMGLYGTTQALETIFWQGLVQHRLLQDATPASRVFLVTILNIALWLPFAISTGFADAASTYLLDFGLIGLSCALLFELGLQTRYVMLGRALMGIGYAWAYHNLFF